jgi:hypothetical protein
VKQHPVIATPANAGGSNPAPNLHASETIAPIHTQGFIQAHLVMAGLDPAIHAFF